MAYKRLSFEKIGGDDSSRLERTRKGVLREFTTPKGSVPFSVEGSSLWDRVDDNTLVASIQNRNELARIVSVYRCLEYLGSKLFLSNNFLTTNQQLNVDYFPDGENTDPRVYQ